MKRNLVILFFFMLPLLSLAQGEGDEGDPDTPINGGTGALLIAGAVYGAKRIAAKHKPDTANDG